MDAGELKDLVRHVVELSRIGLARYYDKAAVIFIAPREMMTDSPEDFLRAWRSDRI